MKKLLSLLFLSTLLVFNSCSSDDEPTTQPTVEEMRQDIHNTFDGFVTCMQGYEDGQFSTSIQSFFSISNGESNGDYADLMTNELSGFDFDLENFVMADHSGIYNWSNTTEMWTYTSNTNNELVFNFPFYQSGTTNNTAITINHYEVQSFSLAEGTEYYPTKILASIDKDSNEIFNIDIDNVTYRSDGTIVSPTNFDVEIRTEFMTHLFTLRETNTQEFEFDYNSSNDNSCNTTISFDASTVLSDFTLVSDIEDFANVTATISHGALKIIVDAQVDNLSSLDEPTAAQINQLIDAKVFLNNSEIGILEFTDDNDNKVIYIVFNDGTREDVTNYVNDELAQQLEAVFSNYTN